MPFTLTISIVFSIIGVLLLLGLFFLSKSLINRYLTDENHQKVVFFVYFISIIVAIAILLFEFYVWNVNYISLFYDDWKQLEEVLLDKIGILITSVIIVFIFIGVFKLMKLFQHYSLKRYELKNQKRKITILKVTISIVDYSMKIILVLILLALWGVNVLPALAGLGILGLVIGFGAQDLMKDFITGFFIIFEKHFDVGDVIEVNGFKGQVIDIGLKTTKVMNWKKDVKIFNNSSVQNAINYSFTESVAIVEVGISYSEDIERVINILNTELPKIRPANPDIVEDPVCVGVVEFAASSINLRVIARTNSEKQYAIERNLRNEIKKLMDKNDIEIPFMQIVLHNTELK
jgi:small conductance mechanosensitive channel